MKKGIILIIIIAFSVVSIFLGKREYDNGKLNMALQNYVSRDDIYYYDNNSIVNDISIKNIEEVESLISGYKFNLVKLDNEVLFAFIYNIVNDLVISEQSIEQNNSVHIYLSKEQDLIVMLNENSTVAYEWEITIDENYEDISIVSKHINSSMEVNRVGVNEDKKIFIISSKKSGLYSLKFTYRHTISTEINEKIEEQFILNVNFEN